MKCELGVDLFHFNIGSIDLQSAGQLMALNCVSMVQIAIWITVCGGDQNNGEHRPMVSDDSVLGSGDELQNGQAEVCDVRHGWIKTGALLGALACVLMVFGPLGLSHFLVDPTPQDSIAIKTIQPSTSQTALERVLTASVVQLIYALAIVATGVLHSFRPRIMLRVAMWCFLCGTLVYCGCQYALALIGIGWLEFTGMAGGLVLLGGWLALVEGACSGSRR